MEAREKMTDLIKDQLYNAILHYEELIEATPLRDIDDDRQRAYGKIDAYYQFVKELKAIMNGEAIHYEQLN